MSTNVLVATSSVKLFTGITSTSYDQLIEDYNPIVLDDIVNYCKNDFVRSTMYYYDDNISLSTSTGFDIFVSDTQIEFDEFLVAGNIIKVANTIQNDGFYSVSAVGSTYISVNESVVTETSSTGKYPIIMRVDHPKDLALIGSKMIKYLITSQNQDGVNSESLGDYSYTLGEIGSNLYPKNITNGLNKYRKIRIL